MGVDVDYISKKEKIKDLGSVVPTQTSLAFMESLTMPHVQEVVISADVRCTECQKRIVDIISRFNEVETHVIERQYNRVSVCGRFRPSDVAIKIRRRMNRRVEILEIQEFDDGGGPPEQQQQQPPVDNQPPIANGHAHIA
ncbi:hypothetical protein BVRB_6g142170 isoform A [Beta vulgaris subsp. vulgaris]|nr:hypothetical protein BVRB_6g142170 isoform A [Beta vulgaris subsp. vulgaris]